MTGEASDPGATEPFRRKKKKRKEGGGEGEPVDTRTPEQKAADHAEHIATAQRLAQVELDKRKAEAEERDKKEAETIKRSSVLRNLTPWPWLKDGNLFNGSKEFNARTEKRAVRLSRPAFAFTGLIAQMGAWVWSLPAVQQLKEILFGKAEK